MQRADAHTEIWKVLTHELWLSFILLPIPGGVYSIQNVGL